MLALTWAGPLRAILSPLDLPPGVMCYPSVPVPTATGGAPAGSEAAGAM
jgi:hypothetical protein